MSANYAWMKFYEAAVLETDPESLLFRIEVAQNAIGQRVITLAVDEGQTETQSSKHSTRSPFSSANDLADLSAISAEMPMTS